MIELWRQVLIYEDGHRNVGWVQPPTDDMRRYDHADGWTTVLDLPTLVVNEWHGPWGGSGSALTLWITIKVDG